MRIYFHYIEVAFEMCEKHVRQFARLLYMIFVIANINPSHFIYKKVTLHGQIFWNKITARKDE